MFHVFSHLLIFHSVRSDCVPVLEAEGFFRREFPVQASLRASEDAGATQ